MHYSLKILTKKQRKMVFHNIKSKYPSLMKNQECKEGKNRMVQGQQGEQCYLIRIINTFQNWTQGKKARIWAPIKDEVQQYLVYKTLCLWSLLPVWLAMHKHWNSHHHDYQQLMKVQRLRGHPDSIVTATTHVEKIVRRFRAIVLHHQETRMQGLYQNVMHIQYTL